MELMLTTLHRVNFKNMSEYYSLSWVTAEGNADRNNNGMPCVWEA